MLAGYRGCRQQYVLLWTGATAEVGRKSSEEWKENEIQQKIKDIWKASFEVYRPGTDTYTHMHIYRHTPTDANTSAVQRQLANTTTCRFMPLLVVGCWRAAPPEGAVLVTVLTYCKARTVMHFMTNAGCSVGVCMKVFARLLSWWTIMSDITQHL